MDEVDAATSSTAAGQAVGVESTAVQQQQVITPIPGARNYGYPDEFMMYAFKVEICNRTEKHPRGSCPFAHPGDVARRRHPSRYQALLCPEVRAKKVCPRLEACQCSHSAFEFWLHPDRYRTSMCEKGERCSRPVCFFAHTPEELRPLPEGLKPAAPEETSSKRASSSSSSSARQHSRLALHPACVPAGGEAFIQQPVQQPIVLQPGMQLMPVAAPAGSPSYAPVGYVPVMQPPIDGASPVAYGQVPGRYYTPDQLQSGAIVMVPAAMQPQQYVLQPADPQLQQQHVQLPEVVQQFQQLVVASAPMGSQPYGHAGAVDATGLGQWGSSSNFRSGQQQQPVVMMMQPGLAAPQPPAAPHQQVVYMSTNTEGQGPWPPQPPLQHQQRYHQEHQGPVSDSGYASYRTPYPAAGPTGPAPQGHHNSSSGLRSSSGATRVGSGGLSVLAAGPTPVSPGVAVVGGAAAAQPTSAGAMALPGIMQQPGHVMSQGGMLGPGAPHVLQSQQSAMVQMVPGTGIPGVGMPPPPPPQHQQSQPPSMDSGSNW